MARGKRKGGSVAAFQRTVLGAKRFELPDSLLPPEMRGAHPVQLGLFDAGSYLTAARTAPARLREQPQGRTAARSGAAAERRPHSEDAAPDGAAKGKGT